MNPLNEYFDKIYCINLLRREDRKKKCIEQFDKIGLDVEFFPAIDKLTIKNSSRITDGQLACLSSHYNIIKKAKHNDFSKILIFEDDVILSDKLMDIFQKNIDTVPKDWKMLYFGGNHLNGLEKITNNVYKMISSLTTHAYAVRSELYDEILNRLQYCEYPVDVYYAHIHREHPSYLVRDGEKQLIWQDMGYSDIDEAECNYTWLK
jgi:GR25 family glycosyltransferase involved in LPS biosynthesis